jgi:hypothetical protein
MKQLGTGAGRLIMRGFPYGIGSAYRSQTHKVFQRSCQLMSVGSMQTSNLGDRYQNGRLLGRLPFGHVVDYFQRTVLNLDLFGPVSGTVISLFLLISFFVQAAHSGAQKGVI